MDYTGFLIAGLSSAGATVITNPLRLLKPECNFKVNWQLKELPLNHTEMFFKLFIKLQKMMVILDYKKDLVQLYVFNLY